jgi:hypothetical protein
MAKPAVFTWPNLDTSSVCFNQITLGAGSFVLNGDLVSLTRPVSATFPGISRVISLTSVGNIVAVNFTITGTLNGAVVSETLSGPNENTVETTQFFDSVTAVSVDAAVGTNTSVGTGSTGATHWFGGNYHSTVLGMAIAVDIVGTIDYSFQTTLNDVETDTTIETFEPITGTAGHPGFPADMVGATATALAYYNFVTRYSRIIVNSSSANAAMDATFLQQGIT